jgi:hypothetical protein
MNLLKRMLRYFNGTIPMGITYGIQSNGNACDIKVLSNSEGAAGTTTKRSLSGEVVMLDGGVVS